MSRCILLRIVSGRGQAGECFQAWPAGLDSGREIPSACRGTWGDWRCALERGCQGETRRPSAGRLGDRSGKLAKKERAPRHVDTPPHPGGPRTRVDAIRPSQHAIHREGHEDHEGTIQRHAIPSFSFVLFVSFVVSSSGFPPFVGGRREGASAVYGCETTFRRALSLAPNFLVPDL